MAKRGSPIKALIKRDFGTPELLAKRASRLTVEAIDLCLELGLITAAEHKAGLKLRWLYFMKFGSPFISSREITDCRGRNIAKNQDPKKLMEAEHTYAEVLEGLDFIKARQIVLDVCIHNIYPAFLSHTRSIANSAQYRKFHSGITLARSLLEQYQNSAKAKAPLLSSPAAAGDDKKGAWMTKYNKVLLTVPKQL